MELTGQKGKGHNLTGHLVNYCSIKIISGNEKFKNILFDINKYSFKEDLVFFPGNNLPKIVYVQMIINALSVGETAWAEEFIETYASRLKPETKKAMYALGKALVLADLAKYEDVLKQLHEVDYIDVRDKIQVKILTAKAYYELNQLETLRSFIDSTRHFIKSSTGLNKLRQNFYSNFLNYLQKAVTLKEKPDKAQVHALKKEIQEIKEISPKKWILEKFDELAAGNKE